MEALANGIIVVAIMMVAIPFIGYVAIILNGK
jgi:hypothetical protein